MAQSPMARTPVTLEPTEVTQTGHEKLTGSRHLMSGRGFRPTKEVVRIKRIIGVNGSQIK
jgi:hypothetical protein